MAGRWRKSDVPSELAQLSPTLAKVAARAAVDMERARGRVFAIMELPTLRAQVQLYRARGAIEPLQRELHHFRRRAEELSAKQSEAGRGGRRLPEGPDLLRKIEAMKAGGARGIYRAIAAEFNVTEDAVKKAATRARR